MCDPGAHVHFRPCPPTAPPSPRPARSRRSSPRHSAASPWRWSASPPALRAARTGSFATAGLVSAGVLAGDSLGAVVQGRVMDRLGPTRPLLMAAVLFAVAGRGVVAAVEAAVAGRAGGVRAPRGLVRPRCPEPPARCGPTSYRLARFARRRTATRRSASRCSSSSDRRGRSAGDTPWPGTGLVAAATAWWPAPRRSR